MVSRQLVLSMGRVEFWLGKGYLEGRGLSMWVHLACYINLIKIFYRNADLQEQRSLFPR